MTAQWVAQAAIAAAALAWIGTAAAEELPRQPTLPLALASKAAAAALEKCRQDGNRVSVAVVDQGGTVKALLRADGAGPHTLDSSRKKAYTALSLRRSTAELGDLVARVPTLQPLRDMNDSILFLGGGLPIVIEGEVVGGIGVGGSPGADFDEACARSGLEAIGANAKPMPSK